MSRPFLSRNICARGAADCDGHAHSPGGGAKFTQHIDNTARDGRRLTVLCYLNEPLPVGACLPACLPTCRRRSPTQAALWDCQPTRARTHRALPAH
jgi:hypothetical protein